MTTRMLGWLLPPVDVDTAADASRLARAGSIAVGALLAGTVTFLALAPLSGAVVAPGVVKVDLERRVVQHREGGIVGQILVRNGDRVRTGQTLMVIDDVQVDAGADLVRTQLDAELARSARLDAERRWASSITFPPALTTRVREPKVRELLERERALLRARHASVADQERLLRQQIAETRTEIVAWSVQRKAAESALRLQREELAQGANLVRQGFVSRTRVIELERSVADYESRHGENQAELARARQRIAELELRRIGLRNEAMAQAATDLKESTARVYDLQERLRPTLDAAQRRSVVAPVGGEVMHMRVTTAGTIVGPRDPLLEIVPDDPDLIVEAQARPEDINGVREGATADVRLTAFKRRTTPVVEGRVIYVAADSVQDRPDLPPHYLFHVRVESAALRGAGDLSLRAGMPAEVYVRTESRTPLQYLLDPVTGYLSRAMREP